MYDLIAKPLEFFYELVPSYAVAIALLTLTIMLILLPLTLKGTRSMLAMQKLQPELKRLQNKHRDDRQKLNEEMMAFYKEHNINPMSGCLPLLLQMPVFFLLYRTLWELNNRAPFGLDLGRAASRSASGVDGGAGAGVFEGYGNFQPKHIDPSSQLYADLSSGNDMHSIGMNLAESAQEVVSSGLGRAWPYLILVLAVAGTSYYQQRQIAGRNTGTPMNPQQAMLMKIMPVFFAFISLTLPAGVVVYFFVSNVFRIAQQDFITRTMYKDEDGTVATTGKEVDKSSTPDRKRSKMSLPSPAKAKADFKPKAGSTKSATGTKASGPGDKSKPASKKGGSAPSRTAPSSPHRSRSKKKRK